MAVQTTEENTSPVEGQHTPGPWKVWQGSSIVKEMDGYQKHIGFTYMPSFAERSEVGRQALADARLMAAAPDLLHALEWVLTAHGEQLHDAFDEAHKAIAKAIGKSNQ